MITKYKYYNWHPEIILASLAGDEKNRFMLTAKVDFRYDCVVYCVKQCSRGNNAEIVKEIQVNSFGGAVDYINKLVSECRDNWEDYRPLVQCC